MTKTLFIIILIIGSSSFKMINQFTIESEKRIYGNWEYDKVTIGGKEMEAVHLNECGYQDVLEIRKNTKIVAYEFEGEEIKGHQIGVSNAKICSISPILYKYVVVNNSCPTIWVRLTNNPNRIVRISEGVVIEYKIKMPNRKSMILLKTREIVNYGSQQPDKIQLKKIKF